jgi:hypothetical protein
MLILSLALSNVERNTLGQSSEKLPDLTGTIQRHKQGMLSDDLMQGKLTQEVITLRARMYKVLQESENYGYKSGQRGFIIGNIIDSRIKGEPSDDYKVEMVVDNERISASVLEAADDINTKQETPIVINREIIPKFRLEDYTKKLYIKSIDDDYKLLEFFISLYVDPYDRKTNLLLSNIKKAIANPRVSDLLDINEVVFISNNTLGSKNFLEYHYDVVNFVKITEFDGNYVIKFKCKNTMNGVSTIEQYADKDLDDRYKNKEKRNNKN